MCKGVDTSHGNANNSRLGEDGEIGEVFEKQTQGSVLVQFSREAAVPTWNVLRHRLGRLQKNTPQHNRRIHSCRISSHQNVVQNTSCCGSQFSGRRNVRLGQSMGVISMYKDFDTHMTGVVLGDASAALAIVAPRGLGKPRHLGTNYLWIQEKAAKGDLNFKKVAGVDNGADLFTKTLSWNEIQSHIHKWSSQFIQNEISVNSVCEMTHTIFLLSLTQSSFLQLSR